MLISKLIYNENNKVMNAKVELECNICKKHYNLYYNNYKIKFKKYNETPCQDCIKKNIWIAHKSKNPKHNVVCENCGKEYVLNHVDYIHNIDKYNNIICKSCRTTIRQKGRTLEEQWGKEKANIAKEKLSNFFSGKPANRKNRKWTIEQKENLKRVRPMKGTLEEKYGEEKAKEIKEKISKNNKRPNLGKPSPQGSGNGWSGWYKGWYFRSLLELSYMINIIEKENLNWISCESIKYAIPYIGYKGDNRFYFADFIIDNKYLIEIKPYKLLNTPSVKAKKEGAEVWCKNNNLEYKILTENDFNKLDFNEIKVLVEDNLIKFIDRYQKKYNEKFGVTK